MLPHALVAAIPIVLSLERAKDRSARIVAKSGEEGKPDLFRPDFHNCWRHDLALEG
jgi:hypothetical protein